MFFSCCFFFVVGLKRFIHVLVLIGLICLVLLMLCFEVFALISIA